MNTVLLINTIREFGTHKTAQATNTLYNQDLLTLAEAQSMIGELNALSNKSFKLV